MAWEMRLATFAVALMAKLDLDKSALDVVLKNFVGQVPVKPVHVGTSNRGRAVRPRLEVSAHISRSVKKCITPRGVGGLSVASRPTTSRLPSCDSRGTGQQSNDHHDCRNAKGAAVLLR